MKLISITPHENKSSIIYHKPDTALLRNNDAFYLPGFSEDLSARLALVIRMKKMGKKIAERFAHRYYDQVGLGINIEAQDILKKNIEEQRPWDEAVSFDYSAPAGPFIAKAETLELTLQCNGVEIQKISSTTLNINQLISETSHMFTLKIGDLIYITLPTPLHKLEIGQKLTATINGEQSLECNIK